MDARDIQKAMAQGWGVEMSRLLEDGVVSGCDQCGRRLVDDGMYPRKGMHILFAADDDGGSPVAAFCSLSCVAVFAKRRA